MPEDTYQKKISWRSPSNIALIKYWGKHGNQLPENPSFSFSLSKSYTETTIYYHPFQNKTNQVSCEFYFDKKRNSGFEYRIVKYLNSIAHILPFLYYYHLKIESHNTFPHSSGIASSASAMSALALGLCSMDRDINKTNENQNDFLMKASCLSRFGSGSACRSVYGGFNLWGKTELLKTSSDEYAIPYDNVHSSFLDLRDAILITGRGTKEISSSAGHSLMTKHPFAKARYKQANINLSLLLKALKQGNWQQFAEITEAEALALHAMMFTSSPSCVLLKPESIALIRRIRAARDQEDLPVCFSIDAGPNIHLIYTEEYEHEVKSFINDELLVYCSENLWIDDHMGIGPAQFE